MLAHGADKIGLTWPTCLLQTVVGTVLDWPSQMSVSPSNFRDDFMVNGGGCRRPYFRTEKYKRRNGHSARTDLYDTREFTSIVFFVARQHNNADARY